MFTVLETDVSGVPVALELYTVITFAAEKAVKFPLLSTPASLCLV